MRKIDVHCHTTKRPLGGATPIDASLGAIRAEMRRHEVVRTVLLATYFPEKGSGISNYRMLHWLQGNDEFSLFGSLDVEHYFYQGYNELEEMAERGLIRGIKLYTGYQQIDFASDKFRQLARLAEQARLPLMFHGGVSYTLWKALGTSAILALEENPPPERREPYKTPADFEQLARAFPEVTIIVSHLCKPFFGAMIEALRRTPNLYTDMSGILDSRTDAAYRERCVEQVRRFVGECGPEKLLFGTDFPVQSHDDSVFFVEQAMKDYADADRQKVYFDNANRLLFGGALE
jgi:predicted TIM-barrel fold metal-dependent hydrolase